MRKFHYFYPRPPRGGRRCPSGSYSHKHDISIHALREEGDYDILDLIGVQAIFLSTPSARRATRYSLPVQVDRSISIHALREEGDASYECLKLLAETFLSTPSARRATSIAWASRERWKQFLSTPSARRATWALPTRSAAKLNFYPRPPRGGRPARRAFSSARRSISIHALREEGDAAAAHRVHGLLDFYPRPPRGGRLDSSSNVYGWVDISIHALREEGDQSACCFPRIQQGFLSTPSARRATKVKVTSGYRCVFLSTPSARRATCHSRPGPGSYQISIHALREEGDAVAALAEVILDAISIHALREEGDHCGCR